MDNPNLDSQSEHTEPSQPETTTEQPPSTPLPLPSIRWASPADPRFTDDSTFIVIGAQFPTALLETPLSEEPPKSDV